MHVLIVDAIELFYLLAPEKVSQEEEFQYKLQTKVIEWCDRQKMYQFDEIVFAWDFYSITIMEGLSRQMPYDDVGSLFFAEKYGKAKLLGMDCLNLLFNTSPVANVFHKSASVLATVRELTMCLIGEGQDVTLFGTDSRFYGILGEFQTIKIMDDHKHIGYNEAIDYLGCLPENYFLFRTLVGDASLFLPPWSSQIDFSEFTEMMGTNQVFTEVTGVRVTMDKYLHNPRRYESYVASLLQECNLVHQVGYHNKKDLFRQRLYFLQPMHISAEELEYR